LSAFFIFYRIFISCTEVVHCTCSSSLYIQIISTKCIFFWAFTRVLYDLKIMSLIQTLTILKQH